MNTSPRFTIRGNGSELVSSPTVDAVQQHVALIEWMNVVLPHQHIPVKASNEELRALLLDGDILCQILHKLNYISIDEVDESSQSPESRRKKTQRFITVVSGMGLPSFEVLDLEKGSMKPILDCLQALKERSMPQFGGSISKNVDDRNKCLSDSKFQCTYAPLSPDTQTILVPGGNKLHEVLQKKPGFFSDLSATKITELIKSNSLDNAPTQSLLSVINGILDETIETQNAELPQRVACLLRKIVQEIERRISTQAEHLRTQSSLFKAREEKYQSRIKVLEELAKGTKEETEIVMNQLQKIKFEKSKIEEKKRAEQNETNLLKKHKDESNVEISTLKQELEMAKKTHKQRCIELETEAKLVRSDLEKRIKEQEQLLKDSKLKMRELEANSQSKSQNWCMKEQMYEGFLNTQLAGLQELRHSSASVKQDMLKAQRAYLEELNRVGTKLKRLAEAAQNYHQVLNENRKLYNELQDLKGNIRVYCRVRPFRPGENKNQTVLEHIGEHGELMIANPSKPKDAPKLFRFNKVYGPTATQAEVFADTQPLIRTILDGYNVCIFAYGQTGSGKTYTMSGPDNATKEDWGVNYRALDDLFQISEDRRSFFSYEIGVQMIEIYNEQIRDLLSSDGSQKKLGVLTTPQSSGLAVPDASMLPVRSTEDVIELMNIGLNNRAVSSTAMNERSSRSHSVLTVHVKGTDLKTGASSHGSLHLVDLAGSERVDRSEVTGDSLREAQHINKSLSALGDVIFALAQKSSHVPYRNSKLTQVLQSSLGGRAKTLMFVQMNPDVNSYTETLSTLKFAERVSGVELGTARSNKEGGRDRDLTDQVASLKEALAKKDEEIERLQMLNDPKSPAKLSLRRSTPTLKNGPSSPSARSISTSSPRGSPTVSSSSRRLSRHKLPTSPSEADNSSDHSDAASNATDESSSRSMNDSRSQVDDASIGDDDYDADERSSEVSDDLSVGTASDVASDQAYLSMEKRKEKPKTHTRSASQPSRLGSHTGVSRLSQVRTTVRSAAALKKPTSGTSSPVTPASGRRRV